MKYGISGAPIPKSLVYSYEIEYACELLDFAPCLAYAVKMNETGPNDPPDVLQIGGNGHGIFQLDSSYPADWANAKSNAIYAVAHFLLPAQEFWAALGFRGDDLVRLLTATFNEGLGNAIAAHALGNVDLFDTREYGKRALANYHQILCPKGAFQ